MPDLFPEGTMKAYRALKRFHPQEWIATVRNLTHKDGEKTVMAMANEQATPDKAAEMFKAEFHKAFPQQKRRK